MSPPLNTDLDLSALEGKSFAGLDLEQAEKVQTFRPSTASDLQRVLKYARMLQEMDKFSGFRRWFVPDTPFAVDQLPKHKEFFKAGAKYRQRYFSAANRCFAPGTEITMADLTLKNVEDLQEGDEVLAYDYATNTAAARKVVALNRLENEAVVRVKTKHREIVCTPDHRFVYHTGKLRPIEEISKLSMPEVVVPAPEYQQGTVSDLHPDVARLIGYLVGDGCLTRDCVQFTNTRQEYVDDVSAICAEHFGLHCRDVGYGSYMMCVKDGVKGGNNLILMLREQGLWGKKAGTKFIPENVRKASREAKLEFIKGLIATDGCVGKNRVTYHTTSQRLAKELAVLLSTLKIKATVQTKEHANPNHNTTYVVQVANKTSVDRLPPVVCKPWVVKQQQRQLLEPFTERLKSYEDAGVAPEVFCPTLEGPEHVLIANGFAAANCGKSISGAYETALHLTGLYPDWWEGLRFDHPIDAWAAGLSAETTRDIIQKEIVGPLGSPGTGMVPRELILGTTAMAGVSGAIGSMQVRHVSGGISSLGFKAYKQGVESFYGTAKHWIWLDELPSAEVFSECWLREMTTGGSIIVTATAKQGLTPLVLNFYLNGDWLPAGRELPTIVKVVKQQEESKTADYGEEKKKDVTATARKAVIVAGWEDAPWLSEEDKASQLESVPPHLVAATTTGLPGIGEGTIYTIPLEDIVVKDFEIPPDWKIVNGMDVGWNFTAAVQLAINPNTNDVYVTREYKRGQAEPLVHAAGVKRWGDWVNTMIDPASKNRSQSDGKQLFVLYKREGLRLFEANNAVDAGIATVYQLLATGQLKFFASCGELQKEYVTYRRKNGRIEKENDHILDALRYACLGLDKARPKPARSNPNNVKFSGASGLRYDI